MIPPNLLLPPSTPDLSSVDLRWPPVDLPSHVDVNVNLPSPVDLFSHIDLPSHVNLPSHVDKTLNFIWHSIGEEIVMLWLSQSFCWLTEDNMQNYKLCNMNAWMQCLMKNLFPPVQESSFWKGREVATLFLSLLLESTLTTLPSWFGQILLSKSSAPSLTLVGNFWLVTHWIFFAGLPRCPPAEKCNMNIHQIQKGTYILCYCQSPQNMLNWWMDCESKKL